MNIHFSEATTSLPAVYGSTGHGLDFNHRAAPRLGLAPVTCLDPETIPRVEISENHKGIVAFAFIEDVKAYYDETWYRHKLNQR